MCPDYIIFRNRYALPKTFPLVWRQISIETFGSLLADDGEDDGFRFAPSARHLERPDLLASSDNMDIAHPKVMVADRAGDMCHDLPNQRLARRVHTLRRLGPFFLHYDSDRCRDFGV